MEAIRKKPRFPQGTDWRKEPSHWEWFLESYLRQGRRVLEHSCGEPELIDQQAYDYCEQMVKRARTNLAELTKA